MSTASDPAQPASPTTRAELLLVDQRGRVLFTTSPDGPVLPGGPVPPGLTPHTAAQQHAQAATGLAMLTPGRMLATDWYPDTAQTVFTYEHRVLTDAQASATIVDDRHRAPRLIAPADLRTEAPQAEDRVVSLLHARIEGRTVELEHGRPRRPSPLDTHRVMGRAQACTPALWSPVGRNHAMAIGDVHAWLVHPAGLVLVCHDPSTGRTMLPGGRLDPGEEDVPQRALGRVCAEVVRTRPTNAAVIGHRGASVRLVADLPGPLLAMPSGSTVLRLLVTPDQVLDLCAGQVGADEAQAAWRTIDPAGAAQLGGRRPVLAVPSEGLTW
ncbi:hypothetical protein ACFRMQ_00400 [Kitasatospora sp. NPDC056783]|uniref:hypothetical protein n=1 Tax=Kitasatospora sp. NPDC056783 TaxID=3345943 RepID=UPI0036AC390C